MTYPKITVDSIADAAYLAFNPCGPGESKKRIEVKGADDQVFAVLDLSSDGRILGVEFLHASHNLPESLLAEYKE